MHSVTGAWGMSTDGSVLLSIGLFWTLFEFANMTCGAVFGWLINDVVPRELMGRFFGMFRALSLIAGMLFSWYILGTVKTHYLAVFTTLGILYGLSFTFMCFRVKEGDYPRPNRRRVLQALVRHPHLHPRLLRQPLLPLVLPLHRRRPHRLRPDQFVLPHLRHLSRQRRHLVRPLLRHPARLLP